jgi:hypothetical protein
MDELNYSEIIDTGSEPKNTEKLVDAPPTGKANRHARLQAPNLQDFTRAAELTPAVEKEIEDAFDYQPWTPDQTNAGQHVRTALAEAVKVLIEYVPPCPDRSSAIRKLREARMDANSAITHRGKY